jgi:hypothetical protein
MAESSLFKPWFVTNSWATWTVFLKALFALPMNDAEKSLYQKHTGRSSVPSEPFTKAWLICGRRSGKSRIAALIATYSAAFRKYTTLQRGETGVAMIIASDRRQADVIFGYISNFFEEIPLLKEMVLCKTKDAIQLNNQIRVEIHTCDYRSVRGFTVVAAIYDELAFWQTSEESVSPDTEILAATEKGSANVPNALHLGLSSPYAREGALYQAYERNYGKDTDELCWVADTRSMNPTIRQSWVDQQYAKDPVVAQAEVGAQFRGDLANFLSPEAIAACTVPGRHELPPQPGKIYHGFVDPSGGSSDSMTLGISHVGDGVAVLDRLVEVHPPFTPSAVVEQFCSELKRYRIWSVTGDYYAAEWVGEQFRKHGVTYYRSEKPKSEIYLSFLHVMNSRQARLLDHPRLRSQLLGLLRRTRSGGKESVDHRVGQHDDAANTCAGAVVLCALEIDGFGFFEFWRRVAAGEISLEPKPAPQSAAVELIPDPGPCSCGAAVVQVGAEEKRCQACGHQWGRGLRWAGAPRYNPTRTELLQADTTGSRPDSAGSWWMNGGWKRG